jgi:hypothetical protein
VECSETYCIQTISREIITGKHPQKARDFIGATGVLQPHLNLRLFFARSGNRLEKKPPM